MGIRMFKMSGCGCNWCDPPITDHLYSNNPTEVRTELVIVPAKDNNPDPYNYEVLCVEANQDFAVLKIRYPDCDNYEGVKILVYNVDVIASIYKAFELGMPKPMLDPHFCDGHVSPIARFVPTDAGWQMAVNLITMLSSAKKEQS